GGTRGLMIGHVAPEAAHGGPIAFVREGDIITIDVDKRRLDLEVDAAELARRREGWAPPAPRYTRGVLDKYARSVSSASKGAVRDLSATRMHEALARAPRAAGHATPGDAGHHRHRWAPPPRAV